MEAKRVGSPRWLSRLSRATKRPRHGSAYLARLIDPVRPQASPSQRSGATAASDLSPGTQTPSTKFAVQVVGAGYVGLVTAACLASLGHAVRCVDVDRDRVERLARGDVPFVEPGLEALVRGGLASGRLTFGNDVVVGSERADIVFIAVGTLDGTGQWTDRNVEAVLRTLLGATTVPPLLVIRSTLRPGRMDRLNRLVEESGHPTTLLIHPEFTKEGTAVSDFLTPDRIVVGVPRGGDALVAEPIRQLYSNTLAPFLVVDHASAEMIKIGSNAFLATKITFANELARFCQAVGADMAAVRAGLGLDPRIGPTFLRTGPGFGGSCLPSQVDLLSSMADDLGIRAELLPAVKRFNGRQPVAIAEEVLGDMLPPRTIAVLGLAFKAGTDDLRESPALKLIDAFLANGVEHLVAFDPVVLELRSRPAVRIATTIEDAVRDADVVVVATEWPEFAAADWARLGALMRRRDIFDARGILDPARPDLAGFRLRSLERGTSVVGPAGGALAAVGTDSSPVTADRAR